MSGGGANGDWWAQAALVSEGSELRRSMAAEIAAVEDELEKERSTLHGNRSGAVNNAVAQANRRAKHLAEVRALLASFTHLGTVWWIQLTLLASRCTGAGAVPRRSWSSGVAR